MISLIFNTFDLALDMAFYNLLLILPIYGVLLMITRNFHIAMTITSILAFVTAYLDQFIYSVRLTHIRFSDFKLISQAIHVANRYQLIWNFVLTRLLLLLVAIVAFLVFVYKYYGLRYNWNVPFLIGLGITVTTGMLIAIDLIPSSGTEGFDFTTDTDQRGLLYSWYCQAKEGKLEAPEGYSKEIAEGILTRYPVEEGNHDIRVVVIMNESLADYSLVGTPRFEDPLPFIHSLGKNAFEGKLAVSIYGGGTANTEFEFLTGCSTAFLPEGSTPYLQYVNQPMENIVTELGDVSKIAIHPYYSEEWNRSQVYRFFDFDRFLSGADFGDAIVTNGKRVTSKVEIGKNVISFGSGPHYVRGLISDHTCFQRILNEDAQFTFAVTMQNHGDYNYSGEDFSSLTYVTEADRSEWNGSVKTTQGMLYNTGTQSVNDELSRVNQYLTLSNLSDKAFEALITDLKKSDQKTIVLLFGDHQPGVLISEHYVDCEDSMDMDYIVPYILWANYDVDIDAPEYISPNYLSAILKKNAGLPLTPWDQFRLEMMEEYPVVTTNFVLDKDGNPIGKDKLKEYEIVQYRRMFE